MKLINILISDYFFAQSTPTILARSAVIEDTSLISVGFDDNKSAQDLKDSLKKIDGICEA